MLLLLFLCGKVGFRSANEVSIWAFFYLLWLAELCYMYEVTSCTYHQENREKVIDFVPVLIDLATCNLRRH